MFALRYFDVSGFLFQVSSSRLLGKLKEIQNMMYHCSPFIATAIRGEQFAPVRNALHLFKLSLDIFYVVKVTKSRHHLSHDQASKGMGLFLV